MFATLGVLIFVLGASAAFVYTRTFCINSRGESEGEPDVGAPMAYILENQVTHARLLPHPSAHAFSYPTLALLVSLDTLEAHALDLARGWLFGYGGTVWRVTGLRAGAYLLPDRDGAVLPDSDLKHAPKGREKNGLEPHKKIGSIKERLREVLEQFGHDGGRLGDAWMLTMPSYLGWEGVNPLTVHYCYVADGTLAWVVLEIHNTFGEKHVHVLEPGVGEDAHRSTGFDHQWTIAREFHVSPFNDRLGHYTVSLTAPPPPPPRSPVLRHSSPAPRPKVRIHVHASPPLPSADTNTSTTPTTEGKGTGATEGTVGPLKLTALLSARHATPLTSSNLIGALARYPFTLLLSFVRILYHAWILHYVKGLDVFPRPDPKPAMLAWGDSANGDTEAERKGREGAKRVHGGTGWQPEGVLEAYARRRTERLLARRADELQIAVTLISGDPAVPSKTFSPSPSVSDGAAKREELMICYTAPRFFSTVLLAPSAAHMLLLGRTEGLFRASSESLFTRVFAAPEASSARTRFPFSFSWSSLRTQWVRTTLLPARFLRSGTRAAENTIPALHPVDVGAVALQLNAVVVCLMHLMDGLEQGVFALVRARFVPGTEPWGRWERAATASRGE